MRERTIKSRLETPAASKTPKNQNVLKRKFVLLCSKMRVDGYPVLNVKQMPKGRIMLLGKQNVELLRLSIKFWLNILFSALSPPVTVKNFQA